MNDGSLGNGGGILKEGVDTLFSPSQIFAINAMAPNLKNGAFWGFVDVKTVKPYYRDIANDPNMVIRRIVNSCIIEVEPNYAVHSIQKANANAINDALIQRMQQNMANAGVELEKFLVTKGIYEEGYTTNIAIYCTSSSTCVACRGVSYPAFRLNFEKTLQLLGTYGYYMKVGGRFVSIQEALETPEATWNALQLAPAKSGVFIGIRSGLTVEQYRIYRKQLKQRYGV